MVSVENYSYQSWGEKFPEGSIVDIRELKLHKSWEDVIFSEDNEESVNKLNKFFNFALDKKRDAKFFPYPDLVFYGFNVPFNKVRVVILGQDPYHGFDKDGSGVPEAMGMSFSVPTSCKVPSSLRNMFNNLSNFGHIKTDVNDMEGNLTPWMKQGVLLINSSLTVQYKHPNVHAKRWASITDNIIKEISDKRSNVVFLLWGAFAASKQSLIDGKKHKIIISSHPSGLSYKKGFRTYPAFADCNMFGETNKYLKKKNKDEIDWDI